MSTLAELFVKIGADTSGFSQATAGVKGDMQGMENATAGAAKGMEVNFGKMGLAISGAGVAMGALAQKAQPLNTAASQLATMTGMAKDEIVDLATATSNATFPLADVMELMETASQRGLEGADALQAYANFWDTVGDATGESATALGEAGAALAAVGIAAGEEGKAMDAFGFITTQTTSDVGEFLSFIERTGPQLNDMGMDVNDAAAMLAVLEKEFGMAGRTARSEFRSAVNDSDGDMKLLMETLGVTEAQFASYSAEVAGSGQAMHDLADDFAESRTSLDKLKSATEDMMLKYGDLIMMGGNLAPVLTMLGGGMAGLSKATSLWGSVTMKTLVPALWAKTVALLASPLTWIVLGIMAIIAAVVLLVMNWDKVKKFFVDTWEKIKTAFKTAIDWIKGIFEKWGAEILAVVFPIVGIPMLIVKHWDAIKEFFSNLWKTVVDAFKNAIDFLWNLFLDFTPQGLIIKHWGTIADWFSDLWENIKKIFLDALVAVGTYIIEKFLAAKEFVMTVFNGVKETLSQVWENIKTAVTDKLKQIYDDIKSTLERAWDYIKSIPKQAETWGKNIIQGLINGIRQMGSAIWEAIKGAAGGAFAKFTDWLGIESPSTLFMDVGYNISEGLAIGIDDGAVDVDKAMMGMISPEITPPTGSVSHNHGGTITVKGVNDKGELVAIMEQYLDNTLYREATAF